ncbi:nuclear transport factor 2 family protein [Aspergillus saccharolyticus JOP 1030-1]|uniref:SnoaL-like domain-containing protein n=1 Tax=Aspergillus saccharolyticus JOP 1030-1 TaxID=1450539 RepID=A0A318ZXM8_9EURO|nr:hypothetical protein BP01DRAFT_379306 [Aspergillus saccharolyticus JOP 1030-1]PYH48910.1 hypothetical protein BP01DRAFT_379306 [Aspergillus saccharolyticus JOP 1030-1]
MSFPTTLPSLPLREAIVDAVYRFVLSFDTADLALFESAFYPDAVFELKDKVMNGIPAIRAGCYDNVSKLDTTHFVTNVRVNLPDSSETKASVTASALAQHYRTGQGNEPGATRLTSGSLYFVEVEKDDGSDGLWKIRRFKMKIVWTEGDWGVLTGE